jgi:hypothetical protein
MFCLAGCGAWFIFLGGEYDDWYLRGKTTSTGAAGESASSRSRRLQQEAAHRIAAMEATGAVPPSTLQRQAQYGEFVRKLGEKGREKKKDYQFAKHYRNWCNDPEWRLRRAKAGITRNDKHYIAVPGGWEPRSWDEEYPDDPNIGVIIETITDHGRRTIMAQRYLPEIRDGDKRVLLIDGVPAPYALARIPKAGETRGNLAAGGTGVARPLTERDREIAGTVGPVLRDLGLTLVGLDVIGTHLTEINVTSPTGMQEIAQQTPCDPAALMIDALERLAALPATPTTTDTGTAASPGGSR